MHKTTYDFEVSAKTFDEACDEALNKCTAFYGKESSGELYYLGSEDDTDIWGYPSLGMVRSKFSAVQTFSVTTEIPCWRTVLGVSRYEA